MITLYSPQERYSQETTVFCEIEHPSGESSSVHLQE